MVARLYLDVDGVLCPFVTPLVDEFGDWQVVPGSHDTPWSPTLASMIDELEAQRVWLTSWEYGANERLCPLFSWPEQLVLEHRPGSLWWKLDALVQHHPRGVPFIWVDDEMDVRREEIGKIFSDSVTSLDAPYLLISTRSNQGLTRANLTSVAAFLAEHR